MLNSEMKRELQGFLKQDAAHKDVTSALMPRHKCKAVIKAQEACVLAGIEEAVWLFSSRGIRAKALKKDGQQVAKDTIVMRLAGENRKILSTERTALNVMGRMSGVATACADAVKEARRVGKTRIALTRKTSPGFRHFDKKAAIIGRALPHRMNLAERILIKENHLHFFRSVSKAVALIRKPAKAEIEVENLKQALEAAGSPIGTIMLDNFLPAQAKRAIARIRRINRKTKIELSGGITLDNLRQYAKLGADMISMGSLTKHAVQKDFGLELIP